MAHLAPHCICVHIHLPKVHVQVLQPFGTLVPGWNNLPLNLHGHSSRETHLPWCSNVPGGQKQPSSHSVELFVSIPEVQDISTFGPHVIYIRPPSQKIATK